MLTVLFTYFMSFEVDVFGDIVYTSKQNRLQFVFVVKATALKTAKYHNFTRKL